jgi:GT2 family glycosyltransferase
MNLGIVQITNQNPIRRKLLLSKIIPKCIEICNGNYTLVAPNNEELKNLVEDLGGVFSNYTAWEKDMSRKWRQGLQTRKEEWIAFLADDILPDDDWYTNMSKYLKDKQPGQYGFRLTDAEGKRHEFGEDWMQFPSRKTGATHRGLNYDTTTGEIEDSLTAYVANCVVHQDVLKMVEPFGIYGSAPDVVWSLSIRQCGFPISFNPLARAYHLGDRQDNRK